MSVLVVGLSHRSAPVELLERTVLGAEAAGKLLDDVVSGGFATEAMVLSTCNRVEVYAEVEKFHSGVAGVSELLVRQAGLDLAELTPHLYVHYEDRAVAHLFAVACGLDSMVVGESEVLGQVRLALRAAQDAGAAGREIGALAQQALRVGKRARAETGIDRAGRSLVTAGLDRAEELLDGLDGATVLVVGAGSMSSLAATSVARRADARLVIANRTRARAEQVAESTGGVAVALDTLGAALADADLVVSCTGAVEPLLTADVVAAAISDRAGRPLVVLDLGLPRDAEPAVHDIEDVTVVDLDSLAGVLGSAEHVAEVDATREIVAAEVAAFLGWQRSTSVAPTVVALRTMADAVVTSELARLAGRLPDLDPRARAEVEQAVNRVVDKLLHAPTVRVKQLAEAPGGHSYAAVLRELFDLDPQAVEAVTRADAEMAAES